MRISDSFPSNYIKASDLRGTEVEVVIDTVVMEDIGDGEKPVMRFMNKAKGLVCNRTNALAISEVFGEETEDWVGKTVILFPSKTMFQGKMVDCLRIKVPAVKVDDGGLQEEPPF